VPGVTVVLGVIVIESLGVLLVMVRERGVVSVWEWRRPHRDDEAVACIWRECVPAASEGSGKRVGELFEAMPS